MVTNCKCLSNILRDQYVWSNTAAMHRQNLGGPRGEFRKGNLIEKSNGTEQKGLYENMVYPKSTSLLVLSKG